MSIFRDDDYDDDPNAEPEWDGQAEPDEPDPILDLAVIHGMLDAIRHHAWIRGFKVEAVVTRITEKHLPPEIDSEMPF